MVNVGWNGAPARNYGNNTTPFQRSQNPLLQDYASAYQSAQKANQQRYEDVLGVYNQRIGSGMAELDQLGIQSRTDLNSRYDEMGSQQQAGLVGRGLSGTTISNNLRTSNERERGAGLNRLDESHAAMRLDYGSRLTGDLAQFMERRQDSYPDMSQYMAAGQMQGQGQQKMFQWAAPNWGGRGA